MAKARKNRPTAAEWVVFVVILVAAGWAAVR